MKIATNEEVKDYCEQMKKNQREFFAIQRKRRLITNTILCSVYVVIIVLIFILG